MPLTISLALHPRVSVGELGRAVAGGLSLEVSPALGVPAAGYPLAGVLPVVPGAGASPGAVGRVAGAARVAGALEAADAVLAEGVGAAGVGGAVVAGVDQALV